MFTFNKHILVLSLVVLLFFITGCSSVSIGEKATDGAPVPTGLYLAEETSEPEPTFFEMSEEEQQAMLEEQTAKMIDYAKKVKALDDVPGIDETVITVNGYAITKRQYETGKLSNELNGKTETVKEIVDSYVRTYAKKSEAERLGLKPLQQDIDNYMEQTKYNLENRVEGTELLFAHIETVGMSIEEYLIECEKMIYDVFQREELRKYLETEKGITDFEKYYDKLVKKADVEILDTDIEKAYKDGSVY